MRKGVITLLILVLLALAGVGAVYHRTLWDWVTASEDQAMNHAQQLLNEGKSSDALASLQRYDYEMARDTPKAARWRKLYLQAAVQSKDARRALAVYEHQSRDFDDDEEASLLVADLLIKANRPADYEQLRDRWKGRETKMDIWFVLDADRLLIEGKRSDALQFLQTHTFEGTNDTGRLIRLALLNVKDNARQAWEYLAQAYAKDPTNPEIRSYRARLLEAVDKPALALTEYIGAAQADAKNLYYQDQLAEFYRRHNRYDLALAVWKANLTAPDSDFIWLKAWFWSHTVVSIGINWNEIKPPEGRLKPFLEYLIALKPGTFWDAAKFRDLPNAHNYLQTLQATFWLRLLNACQNSNENEAWELLQFNPFSIQSWDRDLEILLRKVLTYRKIGTFSIDEPAAQAVATDKDVKNKPVHPYYTEIDKLSAKGAEPSKMSSSLEKLIQSKLAIPSCFLASGWLEAALALNTPSIIPADFPDWVAFGYTQAIRQSRGVQAALEFATKQTPTPPLQLLIGELLIASGSPDAGVEQLKNLASQDTDVGFRAAWLLGLLYIEQKQYDLAKQIIASQPRLAKDTSGKEMLARVAILEGKNDLADKLYGELEDKSLEAKSYLARKAFLEKNWKRARDLTEALLREYPTNTLLRENLQHISEEEGKTQHE